MSKAALCHFSRTPINAIKCNSSSYYIVLTAFTNKCIIRTRICMRNLHSYISLKFSSAFLLFVWFSFSKTGFPLSILLFVHPQIKIYKKVNFHWLNFNLPTSLDMAQALCLGPVSSPFRQCLFRACDYIY